MQRYTFPKTEHLLKRWEFQRIFSENKKYTGRYLTLHTLLNQPNRKVGILVSRKIGIAVKRNRIKRLIREAYRLNKHLLPNNIHLIITPRHDISKLTYKDIEEDLLEIYNHLLH